MIPDEGRLYSGGWGNFASLMEWLTANTDYKHKENCIKIIFRDMYLLGE